LGLKFNAIRPRTRLSRARKLPEEGSCYSQVPTMVTITISGAEKSGALARIAAFLVRKGYPLKGQQVAESASGAKLVKISLAGIPGCRSADAEHPRSKSGVQGEGRFALRLQVQL
jgi:hypothetical protein